jgi:uncharacterized protein (DUF488 family)
VIIKPTITFTEKYCEMEKPIIHTVGHSTHTIDYFLELLQSQNITCLVDVRSVAASTYNPQFNKAPLTNYLKRNGVLYLHFSEEFGARHSDPDLLDKEGKVDFEKVRNSDNFKNGVDRLWKGIKKGHNISLMCSEAEPFDCHRFSMISVALANDGFEVKHIMKDKSLKSNLQLENQLLKKYDKKVPKPNIFEPDITPEMQIAFAYRLRNQEIAYSPSTGEMEEQL